MPSHFLGREEPLGAIEAALGRYEGRVAITALHGLRGVGKTVLAAAYAERHRGEVLIVIVAAPDRIVIHAIGRVGHHQQRLNAAEHALDVGGW